MEISKQLINGVYDVSLSGKFTFNDNGAFREVIDKVPTSEVREVVIHLAHVESVDSAALGMLLLVREAAVKHQKKVILSGAAGQVKKVFAMAKFDTMFSYN